MRRCSGNLEAFRRTTLRRRVMVDVSKIDTSLEVLGQKLAFPDHDGAGEQEPRRSAGRQGRGDRRRTTPRPSTASSATRTRSSTISPRPGQAPLWMASTLGDTNKADAQTGRGATRKRARRG